MEKKLINFNSLIIYLLPAALISGPFFSDLFITISGLSCIYFIIKGKFQFDNKLRVIFIFFFSFYLYFTFLALFAEDIYLSLKSALFYIRFPLFAFLVYFLTREIKNFKKWFFFSLLITTLLVAVDGYFQYFFEVNLFGQDKPSIHRISGLFGDELVLGSYLSRLLPLIIGLFFLNFSNLNFNLKVLFVVYVFLILILIFLTGERASFFLCLMSLIIILVLLNINYKYKLSTLLLSILIFVILFVQNPTSVDRTYKQTMAQINTFIFDINDPKDTRITNYVDDETIANFITTNQHKQHFKAALEMFYDKPIFGYGPKMFREICKKPNYNKNEYSCTTHPHNTYLQLLAEAGIIGFLFVLFPFVVITGMLLKQLFFCSRNNVYLSNHLISFLSCLFITLWPLTTSGNFFNNWISIIYYLPIGFVIFYLKE